MVVEYTSAGQFMLPPVIIYKGEGIYRGWASTVDDAEALFGHWYPSFQLWQGSCRNREEKKAKQPLVPRPASTPQLYKFLKASQNWWELRQQTMTAISALESGEKESSIQLL